MIGGNVEGILQIKQSEEKNSIGEGIEKWVDAYKLIGFLDLSTGDSPLNNFYVKLQESTHIFICDFCKLEALTDDFKWNLFDFEKDIIVNEESDKEYIKLTSENTRMIINGVKYQVKLIDDPMNLHQHLEIYLKYVGSGLGVN
ncbi:hypothetical protein P261_02274 [Lachnospiraceae bacterium TWA4]|nr:hypothetical protein P261_02274 [Lachnospiraceae bacterium TWA4]